MTTKEYLEKILLAMFNKFFKSNDSNLNFTRDEFFFYHEKLGEEIKKKYKNDFYQFDEIILQKITLSKFFTQTFLSLGTIIYKDKNKKKWLNINQVKNFINLLSNITPVHNDEIYNQKFLPFKDSSKLDYSTTLNFVINVLYPIARDTQFLQKRILESLELFITNNPISINQHQQDGLTPLMYAMSYFPKDSPFVDLLIKCDAKTNVVLSAKELSINQKRVYYHYRSSFQESKNNEYFRTENFISINPLYNKLRSR